jgi:hypothetical protein
MQHARARGEKTVEISLRKGPGSKEGLWITEHWLRRDALDVGLCQSGVVCGFQLVGVK